MQHRLNALIEFHTDGNRTEFAELVGWSRPYLSKLLRGEGKMMRRASRKVC